VPFIKRGFIRDFILNALERGCFTFGSYRTSKSSRQSIESAQAANDEGRPAEGIEAAPVLRKAFGQKEAQTERSQEEKKIGHAPQFFLTCSQAEPNNGRGFSLRRFFMPSS
jgi:hypothetical protein